MDSNIQPGNLSFWLISTALNNKPAKQLSGASVVCVSNVISFLERRPLPVSKTVGGSSEVCSCTYQR
jgi:hypothetical protein